MASDNIVYDVPPGGFAKQVIEASFQRAIVVDFWAEWCAPCRALGPVLEKVVRSYNGRAALAKVNIEEDRDLAVQQGVQSIPAVKVYRDGKEVTQFVGALPEANVRQALDAVLPSQADDLVAEGDQMLAATRIEDAEARYRKALEIQPDHTAAMLRVGSLALELGRTDEASEMLGKIEENAPEYDTAQGMLARIEFTEVCQQNGGREACHARVEQEPDNLDARYNYACCLVAGGDYEGALEQLLEIITRDRNYRDQAARDAMLRTFSLVGPRSDLANAYRRKLAGVLY